MHKLYNLQVGHTVTLPVNADGPGLQHSAGRGGVISRFPGLTEDLDSPAVAHIKDPITPLGHAELIAVLQALPLREGIELFSGESPSSICLEVLLNQRIGVERATAAVQAIQNHFAPDLEGQDATLQEATGWPYKEVALRSQSKPLWKLVETYCRSHDPVQTRLHSLSSPIVGAISSLERYYNRGNSHPFFCALHRVTLSVEQLRCVTLATFLVITGLAFPDARIRKSLISAERLLEWKYMEYVPSRQELLLLPRVGQETANTLLLYLFRQPALIVDAYLQRILYRHYFTERIQARHAEVEAILHGQPLTEQTARHLHGRVVEIGALFCHLNAPDCPRCPLKGWPYRSQSALQQNRKGREADGLS